MDKQDKTITNTTKGDGQVEKKRKYYKVGEKVFIKELKKTGKVTELTIIPRTEDSDGTYLAQVEFFNNGSKETRTFHLWEITKHLPKNDTTKTTSTAHKVRQPLTIKVKYFDGELAELNKLEVGDWIDLRSAEDVILSAGDFHKLALGVAMELPSGYEAHVAPRSSTFENFGVIQTNSVGVVDESYKGDNDQWFIPLFALRDTVIRTGDRICQFRIMKKMPQVQLITVEHLGNADRGGFGSTGKN